ncbi:MAG: amidohydrolase, partial [Clostridia bacterium]|nr:amidohydrolase [Clostridia bacterium]
MTRIENIRLYTGEQSHLNGCVLIDGDRILYAGDANDAPKTAVDEVIDGRGGILMPGFYNTHSHAAMTLERGVGSDLPLMEWLKPIVAIEAGLTGEDIYWGTQLAQLEMLRRGVVAYNDMYFKMDEVGKSAVESGMRATIARSCDTRQGIDTQLDLYDDWNGAGDGRVNVFMGIHSEYLTTPDIVTYAIETAAKRGMSFHIHLAETETETRGCIERHGMTPAAYFDHLGMFDTHTVAAHCVWMTDEDIEIMARKGVYVSHNPASNMKLASGVARITDMLKAGVNVSLGTDGPASSNVMDMMGDMRLASLLQKVSRLDAGALCAQDAIKMATRTGALAMGFDDCGLIKAGMQADMILLDANSETLGISPDLPAAIVFASQGLNVCMTMV